MNGDGASLLTAILNRYTQQHHASKINVVHRRISTPTKVAVPAVIRVLVEDFVLDIKGKQVLKFNWCSQIQLQLGIVPAFADVD